MIKAIYIDSIAQTVEPVEVDGSLANYYSLIRGDIMDGIYPSVLARGDILYVDDEGLINGKHTTAFKIGDYPQPLLGSGVIVGSTADGDSADFTTPLDRVRAAVRFGRAPPAIDK